MCGIIAGITKESNVAQFLLINLQRLEYRGYDSSGIAVLAKNQPLHCVRCVGKVENLIKAATEQKISGTCGIAHTRWATHGVVSEANAHPQFSHNILIIHNGIAENYVLLKTFLLKQGYHFYSMTDTEVIAHLIHWEQQKNSDLLQAVKQAVAQIEGIFSLVIVDSHTPEKMIAVCKGSSLVIGKSNDGVFVASDKAALQTLVKQLLVLKSGDLVEINAEHFTIYNQQDGMVDTSQRLMLAIKKEVVIDKGEYCSFMEKEIYEQPQVMAAVIAERLLTKYIDEIAIKKRFINREDLNIESIKPCIDIPELTIKDPLFLQKLSVAENIQIIACGSSYHAGLVARAWCESLALLPCEVEIASEYRSRKPAVRAKTLFVTLSQSGETADTIAALRLAKSLPNYIGYLTVSNITESTLARESDACLLIRAGLEVSVAATKTFTAQMATLLLFIGLLAREQVKKYRCKTRIFQLLTAEQEIANALHQLPKKMQILLNNNKLISYIDNLAKQLITKNNLLFIGRSYCYPIALEGALKLQEICYVHAQAYPAGELKHGPLALIDESLPTIALAPENASLQKINSNIAEIEARGGQVFVFTDETIGFTHSNVPAIIPILYTIPLQILTYKLAYLKGRDVDRPRNLAKSVTVE